MSLYTRVQDFKQLNSQNLIFEEKSGLIKIYKINRSLRNEFIKSIKKFLLKSANVKFKKILSENKIINLYEKNQFNFKFITPNGAIVPKTETQNEFNKVTKNFIKIIKSLGIVESINMLHVPLNLRIKYKKIPKSYFSREKATEKPHSDSWAGENSDCVNLHIPLFGDIKNNRMIFYTPRTFDEKWLRPLNDFNEGEKILKKYKKTNIHLQKQCLVLSDFATLHKTYRAKNCGTRISLDTTFVLKREKKNGIIHGDRKKEYLPKEKFVKLGTNIFYQFNNSINDEIKNFPKRKFKHFSNYKLISK